MAPPQMDAEQRMAARRSNAVMRFEWFLKGSIAHWEKEAGIRVTGIDVNDDGSVVILWQPEGDEDG